MRSRDLCPALANFMTIVVSDSGGLSCCLGFPAGQVMPCALAGAQFSLEPFGSESSTEHSVLCSVSNYSRWVVRNNQSYNRSYKPVQSIDAAFRRCKSRPNAPHRTLSATRGTSDQNVSIRHHHPLFPHLLQLPLFYLHVYTNWFIQFQNPVEMSA